MSGKHKPVHSIEIVALAAEVEQLTDDEAYQVYGIDIYEDGTVYDTVEDVDYVNLTEWAVAYIGEEDSPTFEKRHTPVRYNE